MKYNRKLNAFTLIELLIVIVIASTVMSYALPSFRDFFLRQKVINSTNSLVVDLLYLRSTAVGHGRDITILSNDGNNWSKGWKIFIDKDKDATIDSDEKVLRVNDEINSSIKMDADSSTLSFNGIGGLIGNPVEIIISHEETSKKNVLEIHRSGLTTTKNKD